MDPEPPYGREVRLGESGRWLDRRALRASGDGDSYSATPDSRAGELAYQAAYDSFMDGKRLGANRVERIEQGRWVKKITTPDGIVIYKDAYQNVAVQGSEGRWHVTDAHGMYASSARELDRGGDKTAVAMGGKKAKKTLAKAKKKSKMKVAHAAPAEDGGRSLASVGEAPAGDAAANPPPDTGGAKEAMVDPINAMEASASGNNPEAKPMAAAVAEKPAEKAPDMKTVAAIAKAAPAEVKADPAPAAAAPVAMAATAATPATKAERAPAAASADKTSPMDALRQLADKSASNAAATASTAPAPAAK